MVVFVVFSLWEIIAKADGRLSALRAFRLLRFVRLVHFLPYLKAQLLVLKRTVEKAAALCMLLLFATFVFRHVHTYTNCSSLHVCLQASVKSVTSVACEMQTFK